MIVVTGATGRTFRNALVPTIFSNFAKDRSKVSFLCALDHFSEAISMTKRYFTSPASRRSKARLISSMRITSTSAVML